MSYSSEVLADSPWGYWPLNEPTPTSLFNDESPNFRDLSIVSTAPASVAGPVPGATGQAWTTAAGYLRSSAFQSQPTTATYSLWVRVDAIPAAVTGLIAFGGNPTYGATAAVELTTAGRIRFGLYRAGDASISSADPLTLGVWHHVVCKVGVGGAKIRVNKVDVASSATTAIDSFTSGTLHIRSAGPAIEAGSGAVQLAAAAAWTSRVSDARTDAHYDAMFGGVDPAGSIVATLPGVAASIAGAFTPAPVSGSLSLGLPKLSASLSGISPMGAVSGSLAVTLPGVSVSFGSGAATGTRQDITSARHRTGVAHVSWTPAVAPLPAGYAAGTAVDKALAFGPATIVGTQPTFDVTEAAQPRHRDRIIIGGRDVTFFRGAEVRVSQFQLMEPFGYGTATIEFPQVYPDYEEIGAGDLDWLAPEKRVVIQRVDEAGNVVATDYKGRLIAPNASTGTFSYEVGGEVTGPASLRFRPMPLFRSSQDVGWQLWQALNILGVRTTPRLGPDTGIELGRIGGMPFLDYLQQLVGRAWTRKGNQWTVMPNAQGVYETKRKDRTTIHGTCYLSATSVEADLRRDISEEPNRVFGTGVTPEGKRIRNGRYPGLDLETPPPFPGFIGEGDTGDDVLAVIAQLRVQGHLNAETAPGGYDADVTEAVRGVQEDAGLNVTGSVNEATWNAIFDNESQGVSTKLSRIEPMAQRSYTRKYRTSASGAIIGRNPNYDPTRLKIDRDIDFGSGFKGNRMREWSKTEIVDGATPNWVGTLTIHSGAVVAGEHTPGTPIGGILAARDIRPGMNLWLPQFDGGTLVHVTAATIAGAVVTLQVDTRARDAWNVAQVIERDRESRKDPARAFFRRLSSSNVSGDALMEWSEVGGLISKKELKAGWNVVEVVAGDSGTIQKILLDTNANAESAVAVFGKRVWPNVLQREIGDPLTEDGTNRWSNENVLERLREDHGLLYSAGSKYEPGGYSPGSLGEDGTGILTGRFEDAAGIQYYTDRWPILYVAIWVDRDCAVPAGRIMWPNIEPGI